MSDQEMLTKTTQLNVKSLAFIVVVVSLVVAGASYFFYSLSMKSTEKALQQQIVSLQEQLNNIKSPQLDSEPINVYQADQPTDQPTSQEKEPVNQSGNTYINSDYGFSIVFPETWNGFSAKNRVLTWGDNGNANSIDFGFAIQDSLFNVSVSTKDQWKKINSQSGPKPTYLGESSQYVFAYATAQDASNEWVIARTEEIPGIIATFKIVK